MSALPWKLISDLPAELDRVKEYLLRCGSGFFDDNVLISDYSGRWFSNGDELITYEEMRRHFTHFIEITPP